MRSYESILECHWLDLNSINLHIIIWIKMIKIDWISSFLKPLLAVDILSSPRSFGGLACYGRCLRKGLGHLGWNPNIGMIIPRLYRWCLVHKSPKIVQTQNKWWCWMISQRIAAATWMFCNSNDSNSWCFSIVSFIFLAVHIRIMRANRWATFLSEKTRQETSYPHPDLCLLPWDY